MKYYFIAGEASGDLHASKLIREIKRKDSEATFRCWGGDLMEKEGGVIVRHYRYLAFMGFTAVLLNLWTILKNLRFCKDDIREWNPDVVVLVDYPGFNLRIAEWAHQNNLKVIYYIAPQVWAWKKDRIHKIHRFCSQVFVILPFEQEFHAGYGYEVNYCGHPITDTLTGKEKFDQVEFRTKNTLSEKPIIALIPGSRKHEITRNLPIMARIIPYFPDYQFVIGGVPAIPDETYRKAMPANKLQVIRNQTYPLLGCSAAAVVKSGTSTLEAALLGVPQVVVYRMSFLTALLSWMVIRIKYVSLVNLILGYGAVTELLQYKFNSKNLRAELDKILSNSTFRDKLLEDYTKLRTMLGGTGTAERAAGIIVSFLKGSHN